MKMRSLVISGASLALLAFTTGCPSTSGADGTSLTAAEVALLTDGRAEGRATISPDGRFLAFSDGQNIYTVDLENPEAPFKQLTNSGNAFAPNFRADGRLVYGTLDPNDPSVIQLWSLDASFVTQNTAQLNNSPTLFGTISATDLGFAAGTPLTVPSQLLLNGGGLYGTGVFGTNSYLFDFGGSSLGVTNLNDVFGGPISNPTLSSDLSQFLFTDPGGQIGVTAFNDGVFDTNGVSFLGNGGAEFPTFGPNNSIGYFEDGSFYYGTLNNGFNSYGAGGSSFGPGYGYPLFGPTGDSFYWYDGGGNGFYGSSFPLSDIGPEGTAGFPADGF